MNWDRLREYLAKAEKLARDEKEIAFTNMVQDIAYECGFDLVTAKDAPTDSQDNLTGGR